MVTQLGVLGEPIREEAVVRKFLRTAPERFDQLAPLSGRVGGAHKEAHSKGRALCSVERHGAQGSGKQKGNVKKKGSKPGPNDAYHRCGKTGHWACDYKEPRRQGHAQLVQEDIKESALLMTEVCVLSEGV